MCKIFSILGMLLCAMLSSSLLDINEQVSGAES